MRDLKERRCWAVLLQDSRGGVQYLSPIDYQPIAASDADRLTTCAEAGEAFARLARDKWPPPCSLVLSLDVAGSIEILLLDAFDGLRDEPSSGAYHWLALGSYAEKCHPNYYENTRAIKIIGRVSGTEAEMAEMEQLLRNAPPRVQIRLSGWATMTMDRIPTRPWFAQYINARAEDVGRIVDVTDGLRGLLTPQRPQYLVAGVTY